MGVIFQVRLHVPLCVTSWTICSLPGSSVHGIVQARILQWVAIPSPGDLPNPGIKPVSPGLQADSLSSEALGIYIIHFMNLALYINDTYM